MHIRNSAKSKSASKTTKGVIFLTLSGLIVKLAGLMFKIPLTALIGEEGMGYFNSAYSLFTWFYTISTAGLPIASAMLVSRSKAAGRLAEIKRILHVSMLLLLALGALGSAVMLFGAGSLASLLRVEKSRLAMLAIAPTLLLICQSAALRGYFQGLGMLMPHALSQIAEALGKLFLGIALARLAISHGKPIETAAAYAAGGLTVGIGLGMLILCLSLFFTKHALSMPSCADSDSMPAREIARRLIICALPITLSSGLSSLTSIVDTLILTRGLHSLGYAQSEVAAIWGNYSSLAMPIYNLPPVLIYPLTYALMPELTAAIGRDNSLAKSLTRRTLSLTAMIAVPCALGMCTLAEPILALLFEADAASRGAPMLMLLAPSSFLLCLLALTNTVLQASGRERDPLIAGLIGSAVKLVSSMLLIPHIGRYATPVSTLLCYIVTVTISVGFIEARTPLTRLLPPKELLLVMLAGSVACAVAALLLVHVGTIGAILCAAAVYLLLCAGSFVKLLRQG